jgi:tetratricopeptide (TPR) repeat protein
LRTINWWKLSCIVFLFSADLANAQTSTPSEAQALEQQGKLSEAEKAWRQVTQANPQDTAAFASLGLVLSRQEKYEQAVPAYKKRSR